MAIQYIKDRKGRRWYCYAYKGGPRIHVHEGPRKPKKLPPAALRLLAEAEEARSAEPEHLFRHVIREWERAEWGDLGAGTQRVWKSHVALIQARWGEFPTTVWNDSRMSAKVIKWRDERAHIPRTADIGVTVLRAILKWAKLHAHVTLNVAADIPQLAEGADREDIVWTADDIAAFEAKAIENGFPQLVDAIRLAAWTGMRRADLVSLTFDHVGEFAVSKTALKKSRGKRRKATIPMTDELEALLADLRTRKRKEGVNTILVNSRGMPWSEAGLTGSFGRIRDAVGIYHTDEETGEKRAKHLHDVRGTFCTMLIAECELTDDQVAGIMAWSKERVGNIRSTYVDGSRVVVALGERIGAKRRAKQP